MTLREHEFTDLSTLTGPMRTGQWWSSLVWMPLSQPLFAHPLVMRCVDGGLTINGNVGHVAT